MASSKMMFLADIPEKAWVETENGYKFFLDIKSTYYIHGKGVSGEHIVFSPYLRAQIIDYKDAT